MMDSLQIPWFITYFITLFIFDISPGVTFVMTCKNTIKNRSFLMGIFTALGAATSDGISSIIGFFFCQVLEKYNTSFKILQICGMMILFYFAIKMIISKPKEFSLDEVNGSNQKKNAYKSGFIITFLNFGIATVIVSVISQFYQYVNSSIGYVFLLVSVPILSFLSFTIVAFLVYFCKLWKVFGKYIWLVDKIGGIVLLYFGIMNVINILHS